MITNSTLNKFESRNKAALTRFNNKIRSVTNTHEIIEQMVIKDVRVNVTRVTSFLKKRRDFWEYFTTGRYLNHQLRHYDKFKVYYNEHLGFVDPDVNAINPITLMDVEDEVFSKKGGNELLERALSSFVLKYLPKVFDRCVAYDFRKKSVESKKRGIKRSKKEPQESEPVEKKTKKINDVEVVEAIYSSSSSGSDSGSDSE